MSRKNLIKWLEKRNCKKNFNGYWTIHHSDLMEGTYYLIQEERERFRKEVLDFAKKYFKEYKKQTMEEHKTNIFDELPIEEKASISALGLFMVSQEKKIKEIKN